VLHLPLKRALAAVVVGGTLLTALAACKSQSSQGSQATESKPEGPAPSFVEVRPKKSEGDLAALLASHTKAAHARGLAPYASLGATWCKPCRELDEAMKDERMKRAFVGTYIVHLDVDEWGGALGKVSLGVSAIPKIVALDDTGMGTSRTIDGSAWEDNVPANMAPPLTRFFHPAE